MHTLQATLSVNLTQATLSKRRKWLVKAGETERDKMAGALEEKEEKEEDKGERNNEKRGGRGEKDGNKKKRE